MTQIIINLPDDVPVPVAVLFQTVEFDNEVDEGIGVVVGMELVTPETSNNMIEEPLWAYTITRPKSDPAYRAMPTVPAWDGDIEVIE